MRVWNGLLALGLVAGAASPASAQQVSLEEVFTGRSFAYGKFSAINGTSREFRVALNGIWDGRTLTLREDFTYTDGERDTKTWIFRKVGSGRYLGRREDVIGETEVTIEGTTARFSYEVNLTPKGDATIVRFHDTLHFLADGTIRNTAWVTKWALPVARVKVNFARTEREARALRP